MTDNLPVRILVNKTKNRVIFKIKRGYYLASLTPETMKLLRSTEGKINKNKSGENSPHSEITEVVLVHVINNDYERDSRYTF